DLDAPLAGATRPSGWEAVAADVRDEASLRTAVERTISRFGRLDAVVANAGVVPPWSEVETMDLAQWDDVFAINVRGVVATIKAAVPTMKERGGAIVVMGSLTSRQGHARQCLYTATKHAVLGIVRCAALDLGRYGIRVNALGPGPIATDALLGRIARRAAAGGLPIETALERHAGETALGRMATEQDVAGTALFLASDLAAGVTGQIVPVDAGLPT
ncbi:MAG: SDR family oxidoreductase, partial [Alphaproteobacteria bacterium]|nr:SDR family oxidoreductase [Alphaproteobacteria bacterium]